MRLTECDECETYVQTHEVEQVERTGLWLDYCPDCYEAHQNRGRVVRMWENIEMLVMMILFVLATMLVLGIVWGILEAMV